MTASIFGRRHRRVTIKGEKEGHKGTGGEVAHLAGNQENQVNLLLY
jgi:hypothetical protein